MHSISRPFSAIVFLVFTVFDCFSQQTAFTPAVEDEALLKTLWLNYEKLYNDELTSLPKENKKDFEALYKARWENVKEVFDRKEIYTSAAVQKYMDALVFEIAKSNTLLRNQNFRCYFSRSGVPNASYIGEGIILFNMGLFKKLEWVPVRQTHRRHGIPGLKVI